MIIKAYSEKPSLEISVWREVVVGIPTANETSHPAELALG